MRPGNTLESSKLPNLDGMTLQSPVRLDPALTQWVGLHLFVGAVTGMLSATVLGMMGPNVTAILDYFGGALAGVVLVGFVCRFFVHYSLVCTADMPPEERKDKRRNLVPGFIGSLLLLPFGVFALFRNFSELRRAWVSFLSYDCSRVHNPGVLETPGGSRFSRVAHYYSAITFATWGLFSLPVPGLTEQALKAAAFLVFWPLVIIPPVLVILGASLVLAPHLSSLKECRSEDL